MTMKISHKLYIEEWHVLLSLKESQWKLNQEHDQNLQMDEMSQQKKYYGLNTIPGFQEH